MTAVAALGAGATVEVGVHPGVLGCPGSAATSVINCGAVIGSAGGHIAGLPLGVWGLLWLALFWAAAGLRRWWAEVSVSGLGFAGVAYAVGTELGVGHLCLWCTVTQTAVVCLAAGMLATGQVKEKS